MEKKSFKDNPALAFIGSAQTDNAQDIHSTHETQRIQDAQQTHWRMNIKLPWEYRQYLDDEAWKARISMTEYINRLIAADMEKKRGE